MTTGGPESSVPITATDQSSTSPPSPAAGLQECRDVPTIAPSIVGDDPTAANLDPVFQGVVATYVAEHQDTFGGEWMDREANGVFVVAFTDDPVAHRDALAQRRPSPDDVAVMSPPPSIIDTRPIGEWGVPFDVVQVTYTQDELATRSNAVTAALAAAGLTGYSASADIVRNGVSIASMGPITTENAAQVAAAINPTFALDTMCIEGVISDDVPASLAPGTTLDVIVLPGPDGTYPTETPVQCASVAFTLSELQHMTPIDDADPGLQAVMDGYLAGPISFGAPSDGWAVLHTDDDRATIVRIGADGGFSVVNAEMGRNGWIWSGSSGGLPCDVARQLPAGMGQVAWTLDPAFPNADPTATELHVLATEQACTGGSEMGERLLGPQVVETDVAVRIAFAAIPLSGAQDCPGNPRRRGVAGGHGAAGEAAERGRQAVRLRHVSPPPRPGAYRNRRAAHRSGVRRRPLPVRV